jgi:hypothetical protein
MNHSLDKDSLKETFVGIIRTFTTDKFATAIRLYFECYEKCIQIVVGYTGKS